MTKDGSLRSWGVVYQNGMPYSAEYECLECGWGWIRPEGFKGIADLKERYQSLVGFSTAVIGNSVKSHVVGIFIIECPKCFQKFWFHCTQKNTEAARELCGSWPKN